ncbi:helix-turn-helix transcriptional regulator [Actinocorallia longicatena]|uniref:Helix-turn-helix transcriptional regulator n=1 Tax=Actinocorallia longicatena TaxID=111803 RepID=A0ABP6QE53_9ACTN
MPASPSSSAQTARQRLGEQLRAMRQAARITGREFARRAGWASASPVTMIERGQRTISPDHINLWCDICGVPERRRAELLAEQDNVAGMWRTWKQINRAGLSATQRAGHGRYEKVRHFRSYTSNGIGGLVQSEGYMRVALEAVRLDQGLEVDDVSEAVAERIRRKAVFQRVGARWVFLIEGQALQHRLYPVDVHREQLEYLLEMTTDPGRWPSVSLGIIPLEADRTRDGVHGIWPEESFTIFDDRVNIELISGYLSISRPDEVAMYVAAWERLMGLAVHGEQAAGQIRAALAVLDR